MRELMKKKIENFQVLMEILESLFLLICLDLSHGLIVSEVLCQESFYGDYRTSFFFFCVIFEIVCPWNFLKWFSVFSYQRPLHWQRITLPTPQ